MKNEANCIVRKGYFPETAAGIEDNFAFVSLDADLYQPMLEGLKYFYPRISKGGYIFVHDFFSDIFEGTQRAVLEYQKETDMIITPLGDLLSVVIGKN
jgi:O-methyltransferase